MEDTPYWSYPNGDRWCGHAEYRVLVADYLEITAKATEASALAAWYARRVPGDAAERTAWNARVDRIDRLREIVYSAIAEFNGESSAANTAPTPAGP